MRRDDQTTDRTSRPRPRCSSLATRHSAFGPGVGSSQCTYAFAINASDQIVDATGENAKLRAPIDWIREHQWPGLPELSGDE